MCAEWNLINLIFIAFRNPPIGGLLEEFKKCSYSNESS
jgi:hypothetical protein